MWIAERIIDIVAPHTCLGCGEEGEIACRRCCMQIPPYASRCYRCSIQTDQYRVCRACCHKTVLKHVWVRTAYAGLAKKLVQSLKFFRATASADIIATMLLDTLPAVDKSTYIVHVPTTNQRRRQRGYDQAELTAKRLARELGCKHIRLLVRMGSKRQLGAKRATRLQQLSGAFAIQDTSLARDAPVLLVDDVITTGATLEEAARSLHAAGFTNISATVFAQA